MILGIDPSFSRTGLCLADEFGDVVKTANVSAAGHCYESIVDMHNACEFIVNEINTFIGDNFVDVICEYPVFQSRSGAQLAVLNGYISRALRHNSFVTSITWVGPKHCDSFIQNRQHSKTFIVDYCKQHGWIKKKTTHDECTAIVFVKLLVAIWNNCWKHSYFTWKP